MVKIIKRLGCPSAWTLALLLAPGGYAAASGVTEAAVKSAYVYNFVQLVDWPARDASGPIRICVLDNSVLAAALGELGGMNVNGRGISVSSASAAAEALDGCHVVVVGRSAQDQAPDVIRELGHTDVLTIGDLPQFARNGGMIGFFSENGRVRIELNINAVKKAGLKVSAKLMEVARLVR